MSTGRNTDKVTTYGIDLQEVPDSDIKIPAHYTVAIKCSLKEFIETGDHYLYICIFFSYRVLFHVIKQI